MPIPQEVSDWIISVPDSSEEAGERVILLLNGIIMVSTLSCMMRSDTPEEGVALAKEMVDTLAAKMLVHIQRSVEHTYEMRKLEEQGIDVLNTPPTIQ